jgi:3-oxoadipate enol-lactonase
VPEALYHESAGDESAPVLLLGCSLGTAVAMWEPQVAPLAQRLRVIRYDHRGHGASPVPPVPYEIEDLGRDVLALMDRLGIERASLGGVSLGGMVAMWLGANAPERVERLVLCCTSAHMPPASAWADRAAAVREAGTTAVVADAVVERWLTPEFAREHPDTQAWLRAMLLATDAEGYAASCGAIERMDLRDALPSIAAPTLVVSGADDQAAPPEHQRALAEAIPGAQLETLSPAAHIGTVERAGEVTELILGHLLA